MEEVCTHNTIIQLLFRELPADEAVSYFSIIQQDAKLTETYLALKASKSQLPRLQYNPSVSVVDRILAYSAANAA
jgi:hypothetical protein